MTDHPSGEVPERAKRRTFTAAYKLKIVEEYENAEPGARGEVLRREGLYSSHLTEWRKARDVGAPAGLAATRGRPPADPLERVNQRLRDRNSRLKAELDTARRVKGVHQLRPAITAVTAGALRCDPPTEAHWACLACAYTAAAYEIDTCSTCGNIKASDDGSTVCSSCWHCAMAE